MSVSCWCVQLLNWQKRASLEKGPIMYRIAPQSAAAPKYLVPKTVQAPTMAALDPRGAFVVVSKQRTIIWQARICCECSAHFYLQIIVIFRLLP